MTEDTKFTEGRHRDKTYQEVFENDPEFCQKVLNTVESNKYYPAKFKEFLLSKSQLKMKTTLKPDETVAEYGPKHFLNALSPTMLNELKSIIGTQNGVTVREVHKPCVASITPNGFTGVFYRFFIKKCIFNLQNTDAQCKFVEDYASIFPFKVSKRLVSPSSLPVLQLFDNDCRRILQTFLNTHFDDVVLDDIAPVFLSNIYLFQQQYFSRSDLKRLTSVVEMTQKRLFDGSGEGSDAFKAFRRGNNLVSVNSYLNRIIHLSESGVARYRGYQKTYNQICQLYHKTEIPYLTNNQLLYLPEINIHELFSLLDEEFLENGRNSYIELFEKYVFFFVRALNSESKPVFPIDSVLFESLKSLQKFKKSREDVFDLEYEFLMLTLVYRRKQPLDCRQPRHYHIDQQNLHHVKEYIENLPGIKTSAMDFEVESDLLECNMFLLLENGDSMDVRFSQRKHSSVEKFYASILRAALNPRVKRLVTYNAYRGEESSFYMKADYFEKIKEFIKKYNRWDFSAEIPAEKFITWGLENDFVENCATHEQEDRYIPPNRR